jgi:hypothetical protein
MYYEDEEECKVCPFQPLTHTMTKTIYSKYSSTPPKGYSSSSESRLGICYKEYCMAYDKKNKDCRMLKK